MPYIPPRRAIHLDFHTGPQIPDVGHDFDAATFARPFVEAQVDSVTLFAKCHHGQLYYDTDRAERHPSLPAGLDLLGEQIEALRSAGIRTPIYISVQCDEFAANSHPEWIALEPDLSQVKRSDSVFSPGWQILDMSSPYQDYLADQVADVLRRFAPADGFFLDMCWDQPSCSKWAVDGMKRAGLDPRDPADRDRYARQVAYGYMRRYRDMIRQAHPDAGLVGVFFNSRPRTLLDVERQFVTHSEIEALPTGGWGYAYTPYFARFVRGLGIPAFGMTGRFHLSWGDNAGLKPAAALKYECTQLLSLGLGASVGDLLHPRATPHPTTYALIRDVFAHLAACDEYLDGVAVCSDIGLLVTPDPAETRSGAAGLTSESIGAVRAMQQLRQQFDIVTAAADLSAYRVVVLAEDCRPDGALRATLRDYVAAGGGLIVSGAAALDAGGTPILPELGIAGEGPSPFTHTFLHLAPELRGACADFDTVVYDRGLRLRAAADDASALATVIEPYFERSYDHFSGHSYTPPGRMTDFAGIVQRGRVITLAEPLFGAFGRHANVAYREILGACLDRLLPDPLIRAGGPAHLETAVARRGEHVVVHLLSYLPARFGDIDLVTDPFPLVQVPVSVRLDAAPRSARLQPGGVPVRFSYESGYLHTTLTVLDGHAMLVID